MATHVSVVWAGHSMGRPQLVLILLGLQNPKFSCLALPRGVPRVLLWLVRPGPRELRSLKDLGDSEDRGGRSIEAKHRAERTWHPHGQSRLQVPEHPLPHLPHCVTRGWPPLSVPRAGSRDVTLLKPGSWLVDTQTHCPHGLDPGVEFGVGVKTQGRLFRAGIAPGTFP